MIKTLSASTIAKSVFSHLQSMQSDTMPKHNSKILFGSNEFSIKTSRNDDATGLHAIRVNSSKEVEIPFAFIDDLIRMFELNGKNWSTTVAEIGKINIVDERKQLLKFLDDAFSALAKVDFVDASREAQPVNADDDASHVGCS